MHGEPRRSTVFNRKNALLDESSDESDTDEPVEAGVSPPQEAGVSPPHGSGSQPAVGSSHVDSSGDPRDIFFIAARTGRTEIRVQKSRRLKHNGEVSARAARQATEDAGFDGEAVADSDGG